MKKTEKNLATLDRILAFLKEVEDGKIDFSVVELQNKLQDLKALARMTILNERRVDVMIIHDNLERIIQNEFKVRRAVLDFEREATKLFKAAVKDIIKSLPQEEPKIELCINCNKKPKHFGDYCKRCANEFGIRPTGKVT